MAEIRSATNSGELTQTFLEFLLMQSQQALFAMGKHPQRPPNAPPPNLKLGKMYLDHLIMVRWKTQGNLTPDELTGINNAITHLQNAYAEALNEHGGDEE